MGNETSSPSSSDDEEIYVNKKQKHINKRRKNKTSSVIAVSDDKQKLNYFNINARIDNFNNNAELRRQRFLKEQEKIKKFFEKKEKEKKHLFDQELDAFEQEYDPYIVLEVAKNTTIENIKRQYRKLSLIAHPDKGGDPDTFRILTQAYCYLLKKHEKLEYKESTDFELKNKANNFIKEQCKKNNIHLDKDNFNINKFNEVFDEYKLDDPYSNGYGSIMSNENRQREPDTYNFKQNNNLFGKKFNEKIFNSAFEEEKEATSSNQLIIYDEPEALTSGNLNFLELGCGKIDDFSSMQGNTNFTDYKKAHSQNNKLINPNSVKFKKYKNVDELKNERSNISYNLSREQQKKLNIKKQREEKIEEERLRRLQENDLLTERQFNKLNRLFITN